MDFEIGDAAVSSEEILETLRQTVANSLQSGHPRYFNQLYAGRNNVALAGACMVEALNTNVWVRLKICAIKQAISYY